MSRILLAWELGGNYGHISMLLPLARQLRQSGHTILFAIKDCPARQLLAAEGFDYALSPRLSTRKNQFGQPAGFADILAGAGFGEVEALAGLVSNWHDLFNLFQPTVIVAQYAPVAQFATRLFFTSEGDVEKSKNEFREGIYPPLRRVGLPCLQINTGFESPPEVSPFPCFRPYLKLTREHLLAKELTILNNINVISARRGVEPYGSLQEVLKSDMDLLATLPELDHYQGRRSGRFIGPMSLADNGAIVHWPKEAGPRVFVYLRSLSGLTAILETLTSVGGSVIAVIPDINDRLFVKFKSTRLHITKSWVKLAGILPDMDLAVTHAGHGMTSTALLAGVPMLVIPTTIEQWLVTRNIERLGIGIGIKKARITDEFPGALQKLHSEHSYREKAKKLADKYTGYDQQQTIQRLVKTIEGLPVWIANKGNTEPQGQKYENNIVSN